MINGRRPVTGLAALALTGALVLTACGNDDAAPERAPSPAPSSAGSATATAASRETPSPVTPSGTAASSAAPTARRTPASGPQNNADVMFAQGMVPHHQQAVEMSDVLAAKADVDPRVGALAQQIKAAQGPEIEQMTGWLQGWGFKVLPLENDMDHSGHAGSGMDGMMSEEEMRELTAATGADASRLYLEGMVEHHHGAVGMAEKELSEGKNPEAIALARTIKTTQQSEITEMRNLLRQL